MEYSFKLFHIGILLLLFGNEIFGRRYNKRPKQSKPINIGSFESYAHSVSSDDVMIIDERTIEIPNFTYDGTGPAAWFVVGSGGSHRREFVELEPTVIPDENESCDNLKRYRNDDLRLKLPGDMKITDYSYLAIYCLRFNHNFGYVDIPDDMTFGNSTSKSSGKVDECPQDLTENSEENGRPSGGGGRPPPRRPEGPPSGGGGGGGGIVQGALNLLGLG